MLTELLTTLRAGDTVTVARLNQLGCNSAHIMQVAADLHARHFSSPTLRYEVQRGGKGYYDMLRATLAQPLSAPASTR